MNKKTKLLFLSSEFPPGPGGIGTHTFQVSDYLNKSGLNVFALVDQHYATKNERDQFNSTTKFPIENFATHPFFIIQFMKKFFQARKIIDAFKPDVIFASVSRSVWLGALLSHSTNVPFVAIGHGSEFGFTNPITRLINKWAFISADHIVCVSNFTHQQMLEHGIKPKTSSVIYNGADTKRFFELDEIEKNNIKSELGISDKFILLTVGNVTQRKGQEIVIRALSEIIKKIPNVMYLMVGLPTNVEKLSKLASDLGVNQYIRFMGQLDPEMVVKLNQISDIFLMTSQKLDDGDVEGFGIAVLEAALCGKPAIVSSGSGLGEAVIHNQTGLVVPVSDPAATSQAILFLSENEILRKEMGNKAKERALSEFSWEEVAEQYLELVHQLVKTR